MKIENQILGIIDIDSKNRKNLSEDEYADLVSQYGKENVDNDLMIDILTLYPDQNIKDSQGLTVTITEKDLYDIAEASNKKLENKLKGSILSKAKSWVRGHNTDNYDYITIQEDHNMDMSKRIGFSNGKLEVREHQGKLYLHVKAHIIAPHAKKSIKLGLYREVSATVRQDNTLKEISFVSTPALEHAGMFSEQKLQLSPLDKLNKSNVLIAELNSIINEKKNTEQRLKNIFKEQQVHNNINKLIQNGKIFPRDVDIYTTYMLGLRDNDIDKAQNMLMLAEPVIKLNQNETRNFNYMEGLIMNNDFNQTMESLEKGAMTMESLIKGKYKGQFAEDKKEEKEDKAKLAEEKEYAKFQEFKAKMKGMYKENMDEEEKKMFAEMCHKQMLSFTENESINDTSKTDGDLPDNAKLTEEEKKEKAKMAEYDHKISTISKELNDLKNVSNKQYHKINGIMQNAITLLEGK